MHAIPQATGPHGGPEQRKLTERRSGVTRREEIRFEPAKPDRRSGQDRRKHGGWDNRALR